MQTHKHIHIQMPIYIYVEYQIYLLKELKSKFKKIDVLSYCVYTNFIHFACFRNIYSQKDTVINNACYV